MISEALPGPRLLLVDDDETFCAVLGEALEKRGFAVRIAHNVPDARRLAEAEAPHYAVVDLRMPGPSGLELVSVLCQAGGAAKVVVLTGYASITTAVEAIKLGATHYLTKPHRCGRDRGGLRPRRGRSTGQPRAPADLGGSARMGAYPAGAHGMRRECLECGAAARDA
jgi:ActR/RegA family two-component response regulator